MSQPVLRLVTKESCDFPPHEVVSEVRVPSAPMNEQLSFSFVDDKSYSCHRIEIVSTDGLHGTRLRELILSKKPKVAIDLRHTIRFDFPGTSRTQVLSCFRATSTVYVREPLPWHSLQRRDFISGDRIISQRLEYETVERVHSPVMVFVPKDEHVLFLTAYLNRILSKRSKCPWKISVAH